LNVTNTALSAPTAFWDEMDFKPVES